MVKTIQGGLITHDDGKFSGVITVGFESGRVVEYESRKYENKDECEEELIAAANRVRKAACEKFGLKVSRESTRDGVSCIRD